MLENISITHLYPLPGETETRCCHKRVADLQRIDHLTTDPKKITCTTTFAFLGG